MGVYVEPEIEAAVTVNPMAGWVGNRDGWWYSDDSVEASGGFNHALTPTVFEFALQPRSGGVVPANHLLSLLRLTCQDFRDCEVWCAIDRFTAPGLQQLAEDGAIRWELVQHPYSRDARIIEVSPEQARAPQRGDRK